MTRSAWERATAPRPATECPKCGEARLVDLIDTPRHPMAYCCVCGTNWRLPDTPAPAKEGSPS